MMMIQLCSWASQSMLISYADSTKDMYSTKISPNFTGMTTMINLHIHNHNTMAPLS